ncbi:hypothetical protein TNCV_2258031 [Trichonephila clavipes]|nr:hypothetical protein TNCV_2258031 [Trichonephila clavipes]
MVDISVALRFRIPFNDCKKASPQDSSSLRATVRVRKRSYHWIESSRTTADRDNRLVVRSTVTAPDSSVSTVRCATRTRMSIMTADRTKFTVVPTTTSPATNAGTMLSQRCLALSGQCADPAVTIARSTDLQTGVRDWGAILFDSRVHLVVITRIITAQRLSNTSLASDGRRGFIQEYSTELQNCELSLVQFVLFPQH